MELPYIIGFGLLIAFFIGIIIWLIRDYKREKDIQDKLKR
jgi:hypothetical protein